MLRTIEKYFGIISTVLFSIMLVIILQVDPELVKEAIKWLQKSPKELQTGILILAIVTLWSGIKEFTG